MTKKKGAPYCTPQEQRAKNVVRLIERLRQGEANRDDFQEILGFSASGTRKYMRDLETCKVISLVRYDPVLHYALRAHAKGNPVYAINPDDDFIDAYVKELQIPLRRRTRVERPHTGMDLPRQTVSKVWKSRPVVHEPMLAHLFGLAKQEVGV